MSYRVCSSNDVKENSTMVVRIGRNDIVIGRSGGRLFAFDNSCPHRGASLSKGELKGDNIICYMHGYEYNIFTGKLEHMTSWKKDAAWTEQSPEWRKSGDLTLFPVIEENGNVYIKFTNPNKNNRL
jgi:nitrite reductase/ring-hydroxylating ferredoxin subunit